MKGEMDCNSDFSAIFGTIKQQDVRGFQGPPLQDGENTKMSPAIGSPWLWIWLRELLQKADMSTLQIGRINTLVAEIFKTFRSLNPIYMNEIFFNSQLQLCNLRQKLS